jgi:hypothetical protein
MLSLQKLSLRRSLLLFSLLTGGAGILLFCAAFVLYDRHDFRDKKVNDLKSTADLLSTNANSALAFNDSSVGGQILEATRVRAGIRAAVLYHRRAGIVVVPPSRSDRPFHAAQTASARRSMGGKIAFLHGNRVSRQQSRRSPLP